MRSVLALSMVASVALGLYLQPGLAQDSSALPEGFEAAPVLKAHQTADGDPLSYPSTGNPEIVSVVGTLAPGGRTALHQHPVPVYVYVLEGALAVKSEGGEPRNYSQGEAFLESVNKWHQAFNEGDQPTKILVVFMGEQGKPTTEAKQ